MNTVRLRYAGFVNLASKLISFVTGMVFSLMIARNISELDFGVWNNIGDILGYFLIASTIIPFWAGRFEIRENKGAAKTGVVSNILVSLLFFACYLILVPTLSLAHDTSAYFTLYVLVSLQILEQYFIASLEGVLRLKKPQMIGYGFIIYEVSKVAIGFILIMYLQLGLLGAIYASLASYFLKLLFYLKPMTKELRERIEWSYLKEWIKAIPVTLYGTAGKRITAFTLIFLFVYGGKLARAYYGAAQTIAFIIGHSSALAFALYPKLLADSNSKDVTTSIRMVLMFAIPMTMGVMVLSDSYLSILNVTYAEARPVLIYLALNTLCISLSEVFGSVVWGTEKLDEKARITFRRLFKSKLFLIYTLPYLQSAITLPTVFIFLTSNTKTPLDSAIYVALISLLANIAILIGKYMIAYKCLAFKFPWRDAVKYILATAIMVSVLLIVPHPTTVLKSLVLTFLGAGIYFAMLTLIDVETKNLIKIVLNEIRSKI